MAPTLSARIYGLLRYTDPSPAARRWRALHLTILGIVVQDEGGLLFLLAITVFFCSALTAWLHRLEIPLISRFLKPQHV